MVHGASRRLTDTAAVAHSRSRAGQAAAYGHGCRCSLQIVRGAVLSSSQDCGKVAQSGCWFTDRRPNNSFKPNLFRYGKSVAEKACHAFASTTQVGLTQAFGRMRKPILAIAFLLLVACSHVTPHDAREIAYQRLSAYEDGPSLRGTALRAALTVSEQADGKFLVEFRDEPRSLLWAVIVQSSGESEITKMAIDG